MCRKSPAAACFVVGRKLNTVCLSQSLSTWISDAQVIAVLLPLLTSSTWQTQQAALMVVKGIVSQSSPTLGPWLPALVPALLDAAGHPRPEVSHPQSISHFRSISFWKF